MIDSLIFALCTLALVVVAILITLRVITLEEAAKTIGRILLAFILMLVAVCLARQALASAVVAVTAFFKILVRWLLVTVIVVLPLTLLAWLLFCKSGRFSAKKSSQGGE